jgi:TRAP-type C4-dicarboxylate transport system permease small subunit
MSGKLHKICVFIDKSFELLIVTAFTAMVTVGILQVFFRYVLKNSLSWSEEFQKYMHIWIIFLAVPLAYKNDKHIGMNIFFDKFPAKIQDLMRILVDGLWLIFGSIMAFYSIKIMKVAGSQKSPGLGISMDIVYSCIFIGGTYMIFMAIRKITRRIRKITPCQLFGS